MQKTHSILFILTVFALLLAQLGFRDFTLAAISDRFLWKESLTRGYTNFRFRIGDHVFPKVVIGKDGWMFFNEDGSMDDYQRVLRLDREELERSKRFFVQIQARVQARGGRMLFIIAPDKSTVYPQFMPDEIPVIGDESPRVDQFINYINGELDVVDLRPTLIDAAKEMQVYSKTDTHWNCLGAYYAYQEILNRLTNSYPELQPRRLDEYKAYLSEPSILDMPEALKIDHKEREWRLAPLFSSGKLTRSEGKMFLGNTPKFVTNAKQGLPTLLIFHDSNYIACLDFLLEGHFSRVTSFRVHHDDSYDALVSYWSEAEKADVVMILTAERFLQYLVKETGKIQ